LHSLFLRLKVKSLNLVSNSLFPHPFR